jgi:hypothetical protein
LTSLIKTASTARKTENRPSEKSSLKKREKKMEIQTRLKVPRIDQISHPTNFLSTSNRAQGSSCCSCWCHHSCHLP